MANDFGFTTGAADAPTKQTYDFTMPSSDGQAAPTASTDETPTMTTLNAYVAPDELNKQVNSLYRSADSWDDQAANYDQLAANAAASGDVNGQANYTNLANSARSNRDGLQEQGDKLSNNAGPVIFTLDANLNETIEYESEVTQYAVEDGSPISDNISIKSKILNVDGVVTNMAMSKSNTNNVGRAKLQMAVSILEGLYNNRQVISVTTGLQVYTSMAIKSIRIGRVPNKGEISVSLRLVQIRKVVLKTTASNFAPGKTAGKGGATKAKATNQDDTPDESKEAKGTTILGGIAKKLFN